MNKRLPETKNCIIEIKDFLSKKQLTFHHEGYVDVIGNGSIFFKIYSVSKTMRINVTNYLELMIYRYLIYSLKT